MNILSDLAEYAESESVLLGVNLDLLDRAGLRLVDRYEIVKHKSVEELNAGCLIFSFVVDVNAISCIS